MITTLIAEVIDVSTVIAYAGLEAIGNALYLVGGVDELIDDVGTCQVLPEADRWRNLPGLVVVSRYTFAVLPLNRTVEIIYCNGQDRRVTQNSIGTPHLNELWG
ncbi:MAG: hypothetical protein U0T82_05730 [Bacteroidales bacterium]